MIYISGLGLNFSEIPWKTLKLLKDVDVVIIENYTSFYPEEDLKKIKNIREDIVFADRTFFEEKLEEFILKNRDKNILILTFGNPLFATTHFSLIDFLKSSKIPFEIISSSSIFDHIAKTGLFVYKFGKIASISFHYSEYPYEILVENLNIGAHTLFLLDLKREKLYLSPSEALLRLIEINKKHEKIPDLLERDVIVLERIGWKDEKIFLGHTKEVLERKWNNPPYSIIIPGEMNRIEREFLEKVATKL